MIQNETICAAATPAGGAITVIRVSGDNAIKIADKIFRGKAKLSETRPNSIRYGEIVDADGTIVDDVLISVFKSPNSYTGENSIEISCHGSIYITKSIIKLLVDNGCKLAQPGEFTQRAFLNGKMDLSQAEAVADLIASSSAATHRLAMNQMRGGFSNELSMLRDKLLHLTSLMELELDFSDHEELEFADRTELTKIANDIECVIARLANSFSVGNVIKNGVPVAIIGETNAGKSTLLNALLNEDKAIVSDIHGTTRDVIEDTINLNGITFRFIDTAGIRHTTDIVECIGIERTYQKIEQATIVLWLIDSDNNTDYNALKKEILPHCKEKHLIILFNKCDKLSDNRHKELSIAFDDVEATQLYISAKHRIGLDELETRLMEAASLPDISQNDVVVTNIRHYEALSRALEAIHRAQECNSINLPGDIISEDLRECLLHLSEIIGGAFDAEDVLGNIFRNFCIGK